VTDVTIEQVLAHRIVPVVVIDDVEQAYALGEALVAGGLPVAEVTLRTPAALPAIEAMARVDGLVVGAGTVNTPMQAKDAVAAGASFLVSPGFNVPVVQQAHMRGVPIIPGAVTPTEVLTALEHGFTTCKFFPAEAFGGPATLKALAAPFGEVSFVPTGGVTPGNLTDYLSLPNVVAVGGSWMVPRDAVASGDVDTVIELAATAVTAARAVP